jgi:hypothetical protein
MRQIYIAVFNQGRDPLTMDYFDNLDNKILNKYEKKLNRKSL